MFVIQEGIFSPKLVGNVSCDLNGRFFAVQSNGDILPCCEAENHYTPLLGNILIQSVEEIKNSVITNDLDNEKYNEMLEVINNLLSNVNKNLCHLFYYQVVSSRLQTKLQLRPEVLLSLKKDLQLQFQFHHKSTMNLMVY